jgi:monoamine oxidase
VEGFTPIVELLSKDCDIRLNTQVSRIHYVDNEIDVQTNQGNFTTEKIIITVPLGILKKRLIKFEPELSQTKLSSLDKLDMGILDSLVLKFPHVFWPTMRFGINFCETGFDFRFLTNLVPFYQQPILTLRIAADHAKQLENQNDDIWLDKAMQALRHFFGNHIPDPQQYIITRWGLDPFTYGSYSFIPVGATGEEHDILAEPINNKLFFAGEATHRRFPATVHGAYLSGIREAERIYSQLSPLPPK